MDARGETPLTDEELARAERGRELIAAAMADSRNLAPASLREAVERERMRAAGASGPTGRRRFALAPVRLFALGGVLAAILVALVLVLGGGDDSARDGPSIVGVAAVGRLPATGPAPAAGPRAAPARLGLGVEGIAFPDWRARFAWQATGRRADNVGGRAVTTVFYRNAKGATLGYSIVRGGPIGGAPAGDDLEEGAETYRVAHLAGRTIVTWTQERHTCVIDASSAVPDAKLLELASWGNVETR